MITGVPTQVGTYPFTLTATNTISHADLAAAITILATVAPTVQGTPPAGQVNAPYRYQFQVTGTPYATTTVSDPADLPPGLTLDGQTATLAGTPAGAGTYRFTLIATNGVNPDARLSVTVVITGHTPSVGSTTPATTTMAIAEASGSSWRGQLGVDGGRLRCTCLLRRT